MNFNEYHKEKSSHMEGHIGFRHGKRHGRAGWTGHEPKGHHHHHGGKGACRGAGRFHAHGAAAEHGRAPNLDMEALAGTNTCTLCKNHCSLDDPQCAKGVELAHTLQ